MTDPALRPPPGRYGPQRGPRSARRTVLALWTLGVVGTVATVWVGIGMARTPVTWEDIGFRIDGTEQVEVVYEVARPDPGVPVRCTLEALNHRYGQVGVVEVDVPASTDRVVRRSAVVRTSEQAVTGIVKYCVVADPDGSPEDR
jgi:hypothetical protein